MSTPEDELAALPGFSPPPRRLPDPPGPMLDSQPSTGTTWGPIPEEEMPATPVRGLFGVLRRPRPERSDTRTRTSDSTGDAPKISVKETVKLVSGLLVIVVGVAALVASATDPSGQRALRRPTDDERQNIAGPIASILVRHADPALLNPDLTDLILAGSATVDYVSAGPLMTAVSVDPGMPPDVQLDEPEHRPAAHPFDFS